MKFAHEYKKALLQEGFPPRWVDSAIPYGQLKKVIKKVESELRSLGLDSATLAQLMPETNNEPETHLQNGVAFQYDFKGEKVLRPQLTLFIRLEDGLAVDATLSTDTRKFLRRLALSKELSPSLKSHDSDEQEQQNQPESSNETQSESRKSSYSPVVQRVEVPLTFDAEFFNVLQSDVTALDTIQETEQQVLTREIVALSTDIATITKPSKYSKSDLYRWRELFEIYLEASPFFSTRELDHGSRTSATATQKLQWFQSEVNKRGLVSLFKLPASRQALDRFISINITLLQNLSFQEINQKAITKILKKFDKRTQLGATRTFPKLIQSDSIMSQTMAKAVCAQLSTDIVKIVPQIDDHLCPICFTIYWRPIRMKCKHIFCIRCTVLMQRENRKFCPLCRNDVIMEADTDSIDAELEHFLEKYFPKETREKQIAIETAYGIEQFGEHYRHPSETKCSVM